MIKHNVKATNMELTDAISEYLSKRVSSVEKFINEEKEALANVDIGKISNHHRKGDIFRAEMNLTINGKRFTAKVEKDDLYAAIDKMRDDIVREVEKAKKKDWSLFKRGHKKVKDFLKRVYDRE
jgi:putative sigma-54 modulation protein